MKKFKDRYLFLKFYSSDRFEVDLRIRIPEQKIWYWCGFWELMKWAWVQYFCILIVFIFVIGRIREFIFRNQLVTTVPERPERTLTQG